MSKYLKNDMTDIRKKDARSKKCRNIPIISHAVSLIVCGLTNVNIIKNTLNTINVEQSIIICLG
jgi:hypothetical protein